MTEDMFTINRVIEVGDIGEYMNDYVTVTVGDKKYDSYNLLYLMEEVYEDHPELKGKIVYIRESEYSESDENPIGYSHEGYSVAFIVKKFGTSSTYLVKVLDEDIYSHYTNSDADDIVAKVKKGVFNSFDECLYFIEGSVTREHVTFYSEERFG